MKSPRASWLALALLSTSRASKLLFPGTVDCLLNLAVERARAERARGATPAMVQVGAHLAWLNANDPFGDVARAATLRTVLVEPQPHVARRLEAEVRARAATRTAAPDGAGAVTVRNCAVCDTAHGASNVTFYSISPDVDPLTGVYRPRQRRHRNATAAARGGDDERKEASWTSQLASMSREHILKHRRWIPNIEDYIVETRVPCLTVDALLRAESVAPESVLVLSVDAEGFDADIVLSVDFERVRPFLLVWEFQHLVANTGKKQSADDWAVVRKVEDHIAKFGYECWRVIPENMFCTSPSTTAYSNDQISECAARKFNTTANRYPSFAF